VSSGDTLVDRMHVPAFDGWDGLTLEYVVCWPLGLLLTPTVLRRYNTVFQYLVRLKRAQLLLEDAWATLRTRRRLHVGFPASRARLLQLRQHMAHLVTNLQIYFQVRPRATRWGQPERVTLGSSRRLHGSPSV
jgi:gamma-tubulin complex component 4